MINTNNQSARSVKSDSFSSITLGLLSPEKILERSFGEVLKPETINYRSYKPEKDGLFCEKIFGPIKNWECNCGKYKGIRYRGIVCDRCGVEVTTKSVRRKRMGHITLAVPVIHIWFFRSIPSKISYLLGYTTKQLEKLVYYEQFAVTNPGQSGKDFGDLIDENEYLDLEEQYGIDSENITDDQIDNEEYFEAKMGGEAVRDLLRKLDIKEEMKKLTEIAKGKFSMQKKEEALKRLRIFKKFDNTLNKRIVNQPEWMVMSVLPVIPPELRPLVPLDGGRFAASDLNDLYRRIIIRNNRLKQLMEIKAPDVILRNEKRMLQESVDSLIDNSRLQSAVRSGTRRPLKSLSDSLKGKSGRFRQNLLGKRVDYSGRSVIVVGPELELHECGIPKDMAIELFKPHIIKELISRGYTRTPRSAKLMVEKKDSKIYSVLEYTVSNNPVLLNRAPTLHRLGIQAFQPVLIEGRAIRLHPLVCAAFNADFDGDQMAVHVPLSEEAKMEAWLLMLSSHNILHPATGHPIAIPSQDMILGCYYLTRPRNGEIGEGSIIGSYSEARLAIENKEISLHAKVSFRFNEKLIKDTSLGRVIFNSILPKGMEYYNITVGKKELVKIVTKAYSEKGNYETVKFLDRLKDLGFNSAFESGLSIAISDIHIPQMKDVIIERAEKEILDIKSKFDRQILTEGERYNKVIDVWTHATNEVAKEMFDELESDDQGFNALYMMADSGARGSQDQIKQLAGMRGLMAKPKKSLVGSAGEIIENPIKSNFKEGLGAFEYFISTHGARKGLADTALKTADAGYLTRRLVDVAQDVTISEMDCGTIQGIVMKDIKEGEKIIEPLYDRIIGRFVCDDVVDPITGDIYVKSNDIINTQQAEAICSSSINQVKVRSVLTCESTTGICIKCYGINLATTSLAKLGDAVGIMAAQSIGEPGTQLTLRTFHIGGTASRIVESSHMEAKKDGIIKFSDKLELLEVKDKKTKSHIAVSRNGKIELIDENGLHITGWSVPYGAQVLVKDNEKISKGEVLFSWDPYTDVILARSDGKVVFKDMIKGETFVEEAVEGGKKMILITESKNRNLSPHLEIQTKKGKNLEVVTSILPVKATVIVKEGSTVKAGQILVKIPKDAGKTRDITGGLPRIAELFEARNPANPAVISETDGIVKYGKTKRGVKEIHVTGKSEEKIYKIPYGKHVLVQDKDRVFAGDRLCEGSVSPQDILKIRGSYQAQEYLVESIQEVYRLQQVSINDKHIEVIVRQMMHKVIVEDSGDSQFLPGDRVNRFILKEENLSLLQKLVVKNPGDSEYEENDVVEKNNIQESNNELKEQGKETIKTRKAIPATFKPLLLGITRASLNTESFISAASFQETTRVLTDAAIECKTDYLRGLKENVIIGRLIPAGTGSKHARNLLVTNPSEIEKEELEAKIKAEKEASEIEAIEIDNIEQ